MPCNPCNKVVTESCTNESDENFWKELERKELELKQREKELLKQDKILQKNISKFNKKKNDKNKEKLKAAAKLKHARKQLLLTLDSKGSSKKSNGKRNKKIVKYTRDVKTTKKTTNDKSKLLDCNPLHYLNELINRPCECSGQGGRTRNVFDCESYVQRLFGRPCSCNHYGRNKMFRPCRCTENPNRGKMGYWETATGDCYLMSLRKPPPLWLYHRWPRSYPYYLDCKHQCRNCGQVLLFLAGILFWTPCLLCLGLCKCCFCACSSDC